MTAIEVASSSRLAQVTGFSDQQIALIAQTVAPGSSRLELAWFLFNANQLELQPTLDQIYLIKYKKDQVGEIVIGINGYRAMAESSGSYAGSDKPVFAYEDVGQPKGAPSEATVTVWKIVQGMRCQFTASARWDEFYPGPGPLGEQYRRRPHNQLAVRAESHALRKGFPYQMRKLDSRAEVPAEWRAAAEEDEIRQRDPALVASNARKYDQVFDLETREQARMAQQTAQAKQSRPVPERDHEFQDMVIDNEQLLKDAKDIGVGIGVLKRYKVDPETWSLAEGEAANNELRATIQGHQVEVTEPVREEAATLL